MVITKFKINWFFLVCFIFALILTNNVSYAKPIDFIKDIGMDYGLGFDSLEIEVKRSPFEPITTKQLPGGQEVEFTLKQVTSIMQLTEELDISAEASFRSLAFNGSAKVKYIRSHNLDTYSLYFLIYVKVKNREKILTSGFKLSDEAKNLLDNSIELFHKAYGDSFIRGITTGGEYIGIIRIETKSEQDKKNLSAELNIGGIGWDGKAKFIEKLKKVQEDHMIYVNNIIIGGVDLQPVTDPIKMIEDAQKFSEIVRISGNPVKVMLSDYTIFPEYAEKSIGPDIEIRRMLNKLNNYRLQYLSLKNDIIFILLNIKQFRFKSNSMISEKAQLLNYHSQIQDKISEIDYAEQMLVYNKITTKDIDIESPEDFAKKLSIPNRYVALLQTKIFQIPNKSAYPLTHISGDAEIDGNYPHIWINAKLSILEAGQKLRLFWSCKIQEHGYDRSLFEGHYSDDVFDVKIEAPGLRIKNISQNIGSLHVQGSNDQNWHEFEGEGLIKSALVRYDIMGLEFGVIGAKDIIFKNVLIEFENEEDYLNLQMNKISPSINNKVSENVKKSFWFSND